MSSRPAQSTKAARRVQLTNCRIIRPDGVRTGEDLWWEIPNPAETKNARATIIDPAASFWDAVALNEYASDVVFDCKGLYVAPGYIDLQINGAYGLDFTAMGDTPMPDPGRSAIHDVCKKILRTGCTSYCPTMISSHPDTYRKVIPKITNYMKFQEGNREASLRKSCNKGDLPPLWMDGHATALGLHLEGPFISIKGAHPEKYLRPPKEGIKTVEEVYGDLQGVSIITMAPELPGAESAIKSLSQKGVVVSVGHSKATISEGERGLIAGARFMTHLFNAMVPFHHRDPGLVGLLGQKEHHGKWWYGMIPDGIHAHPASINVASSTYSKGAVVVTDAIAALGLPDGRYQLGTLQIDIIKGAAYVTGTNTLAGAITPMDVCVRNLLSFTKCSVVEAVNAGTYHPAQVLGLERQKGQLAFGCDADVILLDDDLHVRGCFVNGQLVWCDPDSLKLVHPKKADGWLTGWFESARQQREQSGPVATSKL